MGRLRLLAPAAVVVLGACGGASAPTATSAVPTTVSGAPPTTAVIVSGQFCDDATSFEFVSPAEVVRLVGDPAAQQALVANAQRADADAPAVIKPDVDVLLTLDTQVVQAIGQAHGDSHTLSSILGPTLGAEQAQVSAAVKRLSAFLERTCGVSPVTPGTTAPPRGTLPNS